MKPLAAGFGIGLLALAGALVWLGRQEARWRREVLQ